MNVYRITGKKHASDISGTGAATFPGRWNKSGTPILYTGESKEIALLETIVHIPPSLTPALDILTIELPDNSIKELTAKELPANWHHYPAPAILAEIAEKWVESQDSIALKVPSCIIHSSYNVLLNCRHPEYNKVKIVDQRGFHFDSRLSR